MRWSAGTWWDTAMEAMVGRACWKRWRVGESGLDARWKSDVMACGRRKGGASLWSRKP